MHVENRNVIPRKSNVFNIDGDVGKPLPMINARAGSDMVYVFSYAPNTVTMKMEVANFDKEYVNSPIEGVPVTKPHATYWGFVVPRAMLTGHYETKYRLTAENDWNISYFIGEGTIRVYDKFLAESSIGGTTDDDGEGEGSIGVGVGSSMSRERALDLIKREIGD